MQTTSIITILSLRSAQMAMLVALLLSLGTALDHPALLIASPPQWLQALSQWLPALALDNYATLLAASAGLGAALTLWLTIRRDIQAHLGLSGPGLIPQLLRATHLLALFFVFAYQISALVIVGQHALNPPILLLALQLNLWTVVAALVAFLLSAILSVLFGRWTTSPLRSGSGFHWSAIAGALLGLTAAVALHLLVTSPPRVICAHSDHRISVDGLAHPLEWGHATPTTITIWAGKGLLGGATQVSVRATRVRQRVNLLLQWKDPTRSLNRYLIKTAPYRWLELGEHDTTSTESEFWEDQLTIMLSPPTTQVSPTSPCTSRSPDSATPPDTLDVWRWMAISTNPTGQADDQWYGPDTTGRYGFHLDPRTGGGATSNLNTEWQQPYLMNSGPRQVAWIDVNSRFVTPYWPTEDTLEIGSLIPAVITGHMAGDGADVQAAGQYANGIWTVELSRIVNTGSPLDIPLNSPTNLDIRIADNHKTSFSRSLGPIRLLLPE